jgi:hypothetical protein
METGKERWGSCQIEFAMNMDVSPDNPLCSTFVQIRPIVHTAQQVDVNWDKKHSVTPYLSNASHGQWYHSPQDLVDVKPEFTSPRQSEIAQALSFNQRFVGTGRHTSSLGREVGSTIPAGDSRPLTQISEARYVESGLQNLQRNPVRAPFLSKPHRLALLQVVTSPYILHKGRIVTTGYQNEMQAEYETSSAHIRFEPGADTHDDEPRKEPYLNRESSQVSRFGLFPKNILLGQSQIFQHYPAPEPFVPESETSAKIIYSYAPEPTRSTCRDGPHSPPRTAVPNRLNICLWPEKSPPNLSDSSTPYPILYALPSQNQNDERTLILNTIRFHQCRKDVGTLRAQTPALLHLQCLPVGFTSPASRNRHLPNTWG